ncbi:hypothetical protein O9993_03400 [Vibrio lentus]|nr:hypothetical protein [Vibrio lentus]
MVSTELVVISKLGLMKVMVEHCVAEDLPSEAMSSDNHFIGHQM